MDLVRRDFTAERPNRLWVSDFTYVATWRGYVNVAFVIDTFSRRIVGWRVSSSPGCPRAGHLRAEETIQDRLVHHSDRGVQGRFKRSSQHLNRGSCDEYTDAAFSAGRARRAAVVGPAPRRKAGASEGVLGGYCGRGIQRASCRVCGGVPGGRRALVPKRGRSATFSVWTLSEAALRAVSALLGARRDRAPECSETGRTRDRTASRETSVDHFSRAAPQRRHAQRHLHLSSHDGTVARRSSGSPSEAGEAGHERDSAAVSAGPAGGRDRGAER
jgi:hypothetical protein